MEMSPDTVVSPAAKLNPKARLLTAGHLDGRTRASKRARAIAAELEAGFGAAITGVQRQAVQRAAVLSVLAEDLVMRRLAGQPVSLDDLLRVEGVAKRAIRAVLAECPVAPAGARGLELARRRWSEAEARAEKAKDAKEASATPTTEPPDGRA
jgi:hypothetical protein